MGIADGQWPPLRGAVRFVGVDALIDPCRVSGLRPTGGCGHPPLQVRCVGVDALIDPCRVSGLRPTGGSEIRPYGCGGYGSLSRFSRVAALNWLK